MENGKTPKPKKPIYKRVWFWIVVIVLIFAIKGMSGGKSSDKNTASKSTETSQSSTTKNETSKSSSSSKVVEKSKPKLTEEQKDQKILDEYTSKITAATPGLVNEYNSEAASNTSGIEGLATISNAKTTKLAEISNDGISKMAEVMMTTGSGSQDTYKAYASKLTDVYSAEAKKITDAYMASAQ